MPSKGGSSKKGRQHGAHSKKYLKQWEKTARNKENAWKRHLEKYSNDKKAKEDIKKAKETLKKI